MKNYILIFFILNTTAFGKTISNQNVAELLFSANNQLRILTIDANPGSPMTKAQLEGCFSTKDIKNGFLRLSCNMLTVTYQVAKFKTKNGRFLLVVIEDGISVENRWFLKNINGTWVIKNENVFPKISREFLLKKYKTSFPEKKDWDKYISTSAHSEIRLVLPQKGTDLIVNTGLDREGYVDKLLFKMKWNKEKFLLP